MRLPRFEIGVVVVSVQEKQKSRPSFGKSQNAVESFLPKKAGQEMQLFLIQNPIQMCVPCNSDKKQERKSEVKRRKTSPSAPFSLATTTALCFVLAFFLLLSSHSPEPRRAFQKKTLLIRGAVWISSGETPTKNMEETERNMCDLQARVDLIMGRLATCAHPSP